MTQYIDQKIAAWRDHRELFDCQHTDTTLRRRVIKGGQIQYVKQCIRCGESRNQPLAKAKALEASGGVEPPAFDDHLRESWEQKCSESAELIRTKFSQDAFFADYGEYLKSAAWAKLRALVLKRSRSICEGCGEKPATEVHHLTYKHVSKEFLFELVAVCKPCHDRLHEDEVDM
jgi:hypothetical protein